jgi:hypothetical protein
MTTNRFGSLVTGRCRFLFAIVCLLAGAVVLPGCGGGGSKTEPEYKVTGKVLRGGNPLPLDPVMAKAKAAMVTVKFIRVDGGGGADFSNTAFADESGSFSTTIPKGKYRVSVAHINGRQPGDNLKGQFSERQSKIEKEIAGDTPDLVIELDEYK